MKIAAAVVTRNRLADLKVCIQSLKSQTISFNQIIVINNDSSDGTSEWLNQQADIQHFTQENIYGSGGGFHSAIKFAKALGFDFVYCLDDDCIVDKYAIEKLLAARDKIVCNDEWVLTSYVYDKNSGKYGPLADFPVVDFSKPPKRCFYSPKEIPSSRIQNTVFLNWGHFFLGVLFPISVVNKIGLPEKKFFIRGDDYEYLLRCLKYSKVGCVLDSRIQHGMCGPEECIEYKKLDQKNYFQIRNHLYINRMYFKSWKNSLPLRVLKYAYFLVIDFINGLGLDKFRFFAYLDSQLGKFDRFDSAIKK